MQPMLKQILEWGSWTVSKACRAPFQSFLSAASTPSFQRLMASARDMVRCKAGDCEGCQDTGTGEQVSLPGGLSQTSTCLTWCSECGLASLKTTSQCCKGIRKCPHLLATDAERYPEREKERDREREDNWGRTVEERGSTSDTVCERSLPQNASARHPAHPLCLLWQFLLRALPKAQGNLHRSTHLPRPQFIHTC